MSDAAQNWWLEKVRTRFEKQHVELLASHEKMRHYADRRITLNLDHGVKATKKAED
jgi:hypothetical protein